MKYVMTKTIKMKYLPYKKLVYKTKLTQTELLKGLSDSIEKENFWRFGIFVSTSTKQYEGKFNENTFRIRRIISGRNSSLPMIMGVLKPDNDCVRIDVKMRLKLWVIVLLFLMSSLFVLTIFIICVQIIQTGNIEYSILVPLAMLFFLYGLTMGRFSFESNKAKNDLLRILKAELIEEL